MKTINLTKGYVALVDDDDFERLSQYKWMAHEKKTNTYARRNKSVNGKVKTIIMHRFIMGAPDDMQIDHIDGNGLNNQKSNLRICTIDENLRNKGKIEGTLYKYKGLSWCKTKNRYKASINFNGKKISLGRFKTQEEAALAYNKAAIELHGEFARLNVII